MWDRFAWSVAFRQLRFGLTQSFLTMGVVAISVTLVIFLGSLIGGLQQYLVQTITAVIPSISISQPERLPIAASEVAGDDRLYIGGRRAVEQRKRTIEDWQIWINRLEDIDRLVTAVSPVVEDSAIIAVGQNQRGVGVRGVIPNLYNQVVDIESNLVQGRFLDLRTGEVAIGLTMAADLGVSLGERVRLSTGTVSVTYTVGGIFFTGAQPVDEGAAFLTLPDAQSLFGLGNAVTGIGIRLSESFEADNVAERLRLQVPYQVDSWMEQNQNLLAALRTQTQSSIMIMAFTVLAAGFGIASILITAVTSKIQEIGILRAIGATRKQIVGLFTLESTLLAAVGSVIGAVLGIGFSLAGYWYRRAAEVSPFEEVFPVDLSPQLVLGAMAIAVVVGFAASLYPAWKAAKVNPIEVIRGG